MALTPANNEAFLREVDEELRRDQVEGLVRRHGRSALLAIGLALIALAGFLFWQNRREAAAGTDGERLSQAIADLAANKPAAAAPVLSDLAQSSRGGISALARLTQADAALQRNDTKAAIASFAALADDSGAPQPFRDMALIRRTALEYDTLAPGAVIARLQPLAAAGNPWFGSAGEMIGFAQLKLGHTAAARQVFDAIAKDKQTPDSLRSRASQIAATIADAPAGAAR